MVAQRLTFLRWKPVFAAALVLAVSLLGALAFERVYEIRVRTRPPDPLARSANEAPDQAGHSPLTLRLVDIGGVGIPLDSWGTTYSHDRRVFRDAILETSPYVNTAAFGRIEREWHAYVERMLEYGNNAITVPLLLELIDFDRVSQGREPRGTAVYDMASTFRARGGGAEGIAVLDAIECWWYQHGMRHMGEIELARGLVGLGGMTS